MDIMMMESSSLTSQSKPPALKKILLTGATGYVGGRLLHALEEHQYQVRCLARRPENLAGRVSSRTQVVQGDLTRTEGLLTAFSGMDAAYFLVHAMGSKTGFEELERLTALNFVKMARRAGLKRIIYLGGLSTDEEHHSAHMKSRHEVGQILRHSGIPTIEIQASIIIGSGSLSFELIRSLVERLPVMITPSWVRVKAQPIFIDDVLRYLLEALTIPISKEQIYQIGGADVVSYGEIMQAYAEQRGLKRFMIPVPLLTPWLSSLWLDLVTPVYARIGRKLINSIRTPSVVRDTQAQMDFNVQSLGIREAISRAIQKEERYWNDTCWSDSLSSVGSVRAWGGTRFGNRLLDHRKAIVHSTPEAAFAPIKRIGGKKGWYYANWLWRLRGRIDKLVGGVGLSRGRRDPDDLRIGDSLDFWRVEAYEPDKRLRLFAEMKMPGRAWLEFEVKTSGDRVEIHQTAIFDPLGFFGQVYWYALYPVHRLIYVGMLSGIVRAVVKKKPENAIHSA